MNLRVWVSTAEQLSQAVENDGIQYIYADMNLLDAQTDDKFRIIVVPPVFLGNNEKQTQKKLCSLKEQGFERVLAHTVAHIVLAEKAGMKPHGGFRLNITNSAAVGEYEKLGLCDVCASIELTHLQIKQLKHTVPLGIVAYGRLPLMLLRRCPLADNKPCGGKKADCPKALTDRMGNTMKIACSSDAVEILNPDILVLSDKMNDFATVDFAILKFSDESDLDSVVSMYENNGKPEGKLTRGLYFRGSE